MVANLPLSLYIILPVGLCLYFVYKVARSSFSPLHAIPGPKRDSWITGNVSDMFSALDRDFGEYLSDNYGLVARVHMILGSQPVLCVSDPEFMKRILITEPDAWPKPASERTYPYRSRLTLTLVIFNYCRFNDSLATMLFGPGLLSAPQECHKRQRKMLNPWFTAAQMRILTKNFYYVGQKLSDKISTLIEAEQSEAGAVLDILTLASAAALDAVGSAALGHEFDALNIESDYTASVKVLMSTLSDIRVVIPFIHILSRIGPYSFRAWFMDTFCPWFGGFGRSIFKMRDILSVMGQTSMDVYGQKLVLIEKETDSQVAPKTDILSSLVRASRADASAALTQTEAMAQINTMIFAGHESTAGAISHMLQYLASAPDLQSRLRDEVEANKAADDLDYDALMALPLLDAACRELLRLHPPVGHVPRTAAADTVVPLLEPIKTDKGEIRELFIPKGTDVRISITGMNRSTALWGPDAKEFNIDRWSKSNPVPENARKIPGVFSSILTFSGGPRSCIGWRFALVEMKVTISILLHNFAFAPSGIKGDAVKWMTGQVMFPILEGDEEAGPQLLLKVISRP